MRSDIVLVMVDQLGARWLEHAMNGVVDVPNLRRLADGGVQFTNAFTPNPVCSPARASLATGLTSQGHGVTECGYALDPAVPTFMQALQAAGWRTGAFGKLHFQPQLAGVHPDYRPYGFDVTRISEDPRAGEWLDWVREQHPQHYRAAQATVWMTMVDELTDYGPDHTDLRAEILEARRLHPETTTEAYPLPFPAEVSQTAWITGRACDFIRETPHGTPLFAQVSYVQPHNPFTPPAEYLPLVHTDRLPEPVTAEWQGDDRVPYFAQAKYAAASYDTADWKRDRHLYFADIAHLDHEIGTLLECLTETGRIEGCHVIFTSDHGELLHDHGLLGKWERHYDACIRVPLIIHGPAVQPGVRDDPVELTDIAPTVFDLADLPEPTLPVVDLGRPFTPAAIRGFAGRSLCRSDEQRPRRRAVYVQSNNNHWSALPQNWARTVRTDRHRYTTYLAGGGEQLFDLHEDPDEQHNLAGLPEAQSLRIRLRDMLFERVAAEGYPNSPRGLHGIGAW